MWPFTAAHRPFLDADEEAWQIETWGCFLENFGGTADLKQSPLVTPTREFFPPTKAKGHWRAAHIFHYVKQHARMADWPCTLIEQPKRPPMLGVADRPSEAGTFSTDSTGPVITYDPEVAGNPEALIAVFAHELAHYRLAPLRKELPGGEDTHELATDLMTVYLGFGLFGASFTYNFTGYNAGRFGGWRVRRQGYLSERAWVFALAVFLNLRAQAPDAIQVYLKPNLVTDLRVACRYLECDPPNLK